MFFCWQDLKSSDQRDEIAAARATLKENSSLLHSICSACLEHSDVASLTASKDSICNEIQNALNVISNASQGVGNKKGQPASYRTTLGSALDELEVGTPLNFSHCNVFQLFQFSSTAVEWKINAVLSLSLDSITLNYFTGKNHYSIIFAVKSLFHYFASFKQHLRITSMHVSNGGDRNVLELIS